MEYWTQPSVFKSETLGTGIKNAFKDFANRIRYGGQFANEQMGITLKWLKFLGISLEHRLKFLIMMQDMEIFI